MARIKKSENNNCWWSCGEGGNARALLVGMKNDTTTLENSLAVSWMTENRVIKGPSNFLPWFIPKGNENICPHKNLYINVYSSIVHNSQIRKQLKRPLIDKWIYPYNGILSTNNKQWNTEILPQGWTLKTLGLVKEAGHKRPHVMVLLT